MLKTVIVDDELDAINSIELIIREYCPNVQVIGTALSAAEGRSLILDKKPDLVILDIEMPRGSGFDLLEMIPQRNFSVIFITAYNNYAIKAFKFSAVDYILKPIDIDEFITAIQKVESLKQSQHHDQKYETLIENLKTNTPLKIAISTMEGLEYINIADIIRIEAEGAYSKFYMVNQRFNIVVSKNLKEFQELLRDYNFYRPHHSHLINTTYVKKFYLKEGGVEMSDGSMIPISRRKKDEFIELMSKFL